MATRHRLAVKPATGVENNLAKLGAGQTYADSGVAIQPTPVSPGSDAEVPTTEGMFESIGAMGGGDFVGPAGAVEDDIVTFNSATGKVGKDGGKKIADLVLAAWRKAVRKSADESVTSSTTLQADNELLFAIGPSETWAFEFYLFHTTDAQGLKARLNYIPSVSPASDIVAFCEMKNKTDASSGEEGYLTDTNDTTNTVSHAWGTSGVGYTRIWGTITVAAGADSAGTLYLEWAQASSSGTATTVLAGSCLVARRIA